MLWIKNFEKNALDLVNRLNKDIEIDEETDIVNKFNEITKKEKL